MRVTCLVFLAVMSVVVVTDCKPLSDDGEKAPCVGCEQKIVRKKRCLELLFPGLFRTPGYYNQWNYQASNVYLNNVWYNTNNYMLQNVNKYNIGNGRSNTNHVWLY